MSSVSTTSPMIWCSIALRPLTRATIQNRLEHEDFEMTCVPSAGLTRCTFRNRGRLLQAHRRSLRASTLEFGTQGFTTEAVVVLKAHLMSGAPVTSSTARTATPDPARARVLDKTGSNPTGTTRTATSWCGPARASPRTTLGTYRDAPVLELQISGPLQAFRESRRGQRIRR